MKGVKGSSFGVRFYRRAGAKSAMRETMQAARPDLAANAVESIDELEQAMMQGRSVPSTEIATSMTDIPAQTVYAAAPVDTDAADKKQKAFFAAVKAGDCGRIRLLVMEGVDMEARDAQGRTALNIATQYNRQEAIKTLLAAREMRRMAQLGELPRTPFFARFNKNGSENR